MKEDDFIEDVQSLIKQYGLEPESVNQLKMVNELIENFEGKIHLYEGLMNGFKTSITVWKAIAKEICKTKK